MKFWAVLGSRGSREKKPPPNCHKYATFLGWFFQLFVGKKKLRFLKNILASTLKSYIA
jgi:hypothetical protein